MNSLLGVRTETFGHQGAKQSKTQRVTSSKDSIENAGSRRNDGLTATDLQLDDHRQQRANRSLRTAFFGTSGSFSHRVLKKIGPEHMNLQAIFCDASEPFHPSLGFDLHKLAPPPRLDSTDGSDIEEIRLHVDSDQPTTSIIDIGWHYDIPVYSVGSIGAKAVADALEAFRVDVACVACFNKKIPSSLLSIPRLGFLNLHPSMLPDYRGPEPIQWILHDGAQGGVTIHWMDENFDTGDIAYQMEVDLSPSMNYYRAENICADWGAVAYLKVIGELLNGTIPRTPQEDSGFYRGRLGR